MEKTEFELLKQLMQDMANLNCTLALMNINKFFPSKAVKESTETFWKDRKDFFKEDSQSKA